MEISVIVPTFNRAHGLTDCIMHILSQEGMEAVDWDLVIVDNNSSDSTAELVRSLQMKYDGKIRYVFEPQQGVSHARNRGIQSTDSRFLAYVDDDTLVEPNWLKAIYSTFERNHGDAVGGRIWIRSPYRLPKWINEDMRGFLGHLDFGDAPFRMDGRKAYPFGANMAFDRRVFDRIGLFDVRIGRKGEGRKREELFKSEEPDLFRRLADAEGIIDYAPDAISYHKILPHQLEKRFFRVLHFNEGYQKAVLSNDDFQRLILGVPPFLIRQAFVAAYEYVLQVFARGVDQAFRQQMTLGYVVGSICGYHEKYSKNNS